MRLFFSIQVHGLRLVIENRIMALIQNGNETYSSRYEKLFWLAIRF